MNELIDKGLVRILFFTCLCSNLEKGISKSAFFFGYVFAKTKLKSECFCVWNWSTLVSYHAENPTQQAASLTKMSITKYCKNTNHFIVDKLWAQWDISQCGTFRTKVAFSHRFFFIYIFISLQIAGMGWVCRLRLPAAPAAAAPIASRLGGEGGQPGTHLLCQPQQPLYAVETALQHVRLSSSNQKHTTDPFETHTFCLKVVGIFPCSVNPDDD